MKVQVFTWSEVGSFLDRDPERARLEQWWDGPDRQPINLYGRRRTGKSWLFRRVAHGKPAVILVARRIAAGKQLSDFAEQLAPVLGFRPDISSVPELFRILLRAARNEKFLAVVDEFPYLLPRRAASAEELLSGIAAVFEEEYGDSQLKLIVCGSTIQTMTSLQSERNPLHGRLTPLVLRPVDFSRARLFMPALDPIVAFERFAITGGMPRYLSLLGSGPTKETVCQQILDQNSPLYSEVKSALGQELLESTQYFSILEQLADGDKTISDIADPLRQKASDLSTYLETLSQLDLVERRLPLGAEETSRNGHWHLDDSFFAFWFRYVFPFQDDLENGLAASNLYDAEVAPTLNEHVSHVFEEWGRRWVRGNFGQIATQVSSWWGNALNGYRQSGHRSSEEIDIVGTARSRVTLVGEVKWTNRPMTLGVLSDLETYKLPALVQARMRMVRDPTIVLMSKSGYAEPLVKRAAADPRLNLVDLPAELAK